MTPHWKSQVKKTGKGKEHSFVRIPHFILKSQEFGALDAYEVKLLMELAKEYKGYNNGDFNAVFSILKHRGWTSAGTLNAKLKSLCEKGWIVVTRHGYRGRCSLYGVTWWSLDECYGKMLETGLERLPRHSWKTESSVVQRSNVVG